MKEKNLDRMKSQDFYIYPNILHVDMNTRGIAIGDLGLMHFHAKNSYMHNISVVEIRRTCGPIGHFSRMSHKNVRVPDKMSDRKYKNIHLVDEKKRDTSDHKGQQLGFMSSSCFFRHSLAL